MPSRSVRDSKSKKAVDRYEPAHGRDFEIEKIHTFDEYLTSRTRDRIAYVVLAAVIGSMLSAFVYGFWQNNFSPLKDVWTGAGPLTGAIIGYYFHRGRKE